MAIATNMISVGLDITRLGLMVVLGQPKTCAEYIQATSRVGRDPDRPGLVVTLLNIHRPRDRSHYERFEVFHQSFYRTVEATSVTPFSPRALDRGLAGTLVALSRLGHAADDAAQGGGRDPPRAERSGLRGPDALRPGEQPRHPGSRRIRGAPPGRPRPGEGPVRHLEPDRPRVPATRAPPCNTTRPKSGPRSRCCTTSSIPNSRPCTPDTRNSGRTARCATSSRA